MKYGRRNKKWMKRLKGLEDEFMALWDNTAIILLYPDHKKSKEFDLLCKAKTRYIKFYRYLYGNKAY